MGDVRIGLVDVKAFLDDGLVVSVQRNAGGVECTRPAEAACFSDEDVVFAISILIDPLADGRAEERWCQGLRPRATIRKDAAVVIDVVDQNVERPGRDDEFELAIAIGDARHARRPAQIGLVVIALSALVSVGIEDRLVLRRERSLLVARPPARAADRAPLPAEVGVFCIVPGPGAGHRDAKRANERDCTDRTSVKHLHSPWFDALLKCVAMQSA